MLLAMNWTVNLSELGAYQSSDWPPEDHEPSCSPLPEEAGRALITAMPTSSPPWPSSAS
jgi:hypothetical protein